MRIRTYLSPEDIALIKLKSLAPEDWEACLDYCIHSYWGIHEMNTFVSMVGKLPPDSARFLDPGTVIEIYRVAQTYTEEK